MISDDQLEADLWDEMKEFITVPGGERVDTYEVGFDSYVKMYTLFKLDELVVTLQRIQGALDDIRRHGVGPA
jgi:hypothetical protein